TMPSQPLASMPGMLPPAPAPKKSRTGLWIALAVVVVLLAAGGGGGLFALNLYKAPGDAAIKYCDALKGQNYDTAYSLLSSGLQAKYSKDQFRLGSKTLDVVEGPVTACKQATSSNAYQFSLGDSTASVAAVLTRGQKGDLSGTLHLKNEGGTWKIDGIDTALLGVNLDALGTAFAFCAALQAHDYPTAYGFVGSSLSAQGSQTEFTTAAAAWDQIDGAVTGCALTGLGSDNSDTAATLNVGVTRAKAGARSGTIGLAVEGGAWKISQLDSSLLGPDLAPLAVGSLLCADLAAAK